MTQNTTQPSAAVDPLEVYRQRFNDMQKKGGGGDKTPKFDPKPGQGGAAQTYRIRILPPAHGLALWFYDTFTHWVSDVTETPPQRRPVLCARKMAEIADPPATARCLICDVQKALYGTRAAKDEQMARNMYAGRRGFMNVVDLAAPDKVLTWGASKTVMADLLWLYADAEVGKNFVDPAAGYNLAVTRTGTGRDDTKYRIQCANAPSAIPPEWLEQSHDLRKCVTMMDHDAVRALIPRLGLPLSAPRLAGLLGEGTTVDVTPPAGQARDVTPPAQQRQAAPPAQQQAPPKQAAPPVRDAGAALADEFGEPIQAPGGVKDDDIPF